MFVRIKTKVRRIGEKNGKSFKGVSRTKKKKKHMKRLSFMTQFNIQFLLLFTGCRKVLGKMPADWLSNHMLVCQTMHTTDFTCLRQFIFVPGNLCGQNLFLITFSNMVSHLHQFLWSPSSSLMSCSLIISLLVILIILKITDFRLSVRVRFANLLFSALHFER